MKEGRKPEYPEKTPCNELQKMPHTKARRFKPQARLEPAQYHWWQAMKADVLTVTPRVAPHMHCGNKKKTLIIDITDERKRLKSHSQGLGMICFLADQLWYYMEGNLGDTDEDKTECIRSFPQPY